jgi:uncharacterized protein YodC (DUF2158 family)
MADTKKIEVGSIVRHSKLHDGPKMLVSTMLSGGAVKCSWFDKSHVFRVVDFPLEHLVVDVSA